MSAGASLFVPITPCRLIDTRSSGPVGPRSTPLGPGETVTFNVRGTNGQCTIPADATGVAANVTTLNGTAESFLTIWPSDAQKPNASTNNWIAGRSATPNKVDIKLSANGAISVYNDAGTINVIADVVGFYEPAAGGSGGSGPQGPPGVSGYQVVEKTVNVAANGFLADSVSCPAGKRPLSGNYLILVGGTNNFGAPRMAQSQITPTAWGVIIENPNGGAFTAVLQAVCATVS